MILLQFTALATVLWLITMRLCLRPTFERIRAREGK